MSHQSEWNWRRDPVLPGVGLALLAAIAFGVTTPFVHQLGRDVGAMSTAAFLYAGASMASIEVFDRSGTHDAPVGLAHAPRLLAVALMGAAFAPICLTWGLQHTDAASASLLLNFEAVFTVALAWLIHREAIGMRVALALGAMGAGGVLLVTADGHLRHGLGLGALAVVLSTLGWALDNTLARSLADLNATQVVKWKSALGACFSLALAFALRQPFPRLVPMIGLLACGATGYGLSLRLYLLAQRHMGAARTGSVFSIAPFVGVAAAWTLGDGRVSALSCAATTLFALGVYLHLTEKHAHSHAHEALRHEHAHRHDDGHHDHEHYPPVVGTHGHPHTHDARSHSHPHAPDLHHRHGHD